MYIYIFFFLSCNPRDVRVARELSDSGYCVRIPSHNFVTIYTNNLGSLFPTLCRIRRISEFHFGLINKRVDENVLRFPRSAIASVSYSTLIIFCYHVCMQLILWIDVKPRRSCWIYALIVIDINLVCPRSLRESRVKYMPVTRIDLHARLQMYVNKS